jgi:hypothetical protein
MLMPRPEDTKLHGHILLLQYLTYLTYLYSPLSILSGYHLSILIKMALSGQAESLAIVTIFLLCLSQIIVSLRCWVRISIKAFGLDDWLMAIGQVRLSYIFTGDKGNLIRTLISKGHLFWGLYSNHHRRAQWHRNSRYTSNAEPDDDCARG